MPTTLRAMQAGVEQWTSTRTSPRTASHWQQRRVVIVPCRWARRRAGRRACCSSRGPGPSWPAATSSSPTTSRPSPSPVLAHRLTLTVQAWTGGVKRRTGGDRGRQLRTRAACRRYPRAGARRRTGRTSGVTARQDDDAARRPTWFAARWNLEPRGSGSGRGRHRVCLPPASVVSRVDLALVGIPLLAFRRARLGSAPARPGTASASQLTVEAARHDPG